MSEYKNEFKTGTVKRIDYGSKQADMIRQAAETKGMMPNDYVKKAVLQQAQACK